MKHTVDDIELKIEPEFRMLHNRVGVFNTHFQNFGHYNIPKAQLILADPPYNLGVNAYASNPSWYKDGDNKNGESEHAGEEFFDTDKDFRPAEFISLLFADVTTRTEREGQSTMHDYLLRMGTAVLLQGIR